MTTQINSQKTITETTINSWTFDSFKIINIEVKENGVDVNIGLFDTNDNSFVSMFPIKTITKSLLPNDYADMTPSDLNNYIKEYLESL